jgi:hypothetical protein
MVALEPSPAYHRLLAGVTARLENTAPLAAAIGPMTDLNRAADLYAAGDRRGPRALAAAIDACEAGAMYTGSMEGATLADEALAALLAVVMAESADERGDAAASLRYYTLGFRLMATKPAILPVRVPLNGALHALAENEVSLFCDFSVVLSCRCLHDGEPISDDTLAVLRATCADEARSAAVRLVAHMCLGCAAQLTGGAASEFKQEPGDTSLRMVTFSREIQRAPGDTSTRLITIPGDDPRLAEIMHHNRAVRDLADEALEVCPVPMRRHLHVIIDEAHQVASQQGMREIDKPTDVLREVE